MNKKEYLPFHAQTIMLISSKLKCPIYWAHGNNEKSITFYDYSPYNREKNTLISNEKELLHALSEKAENSLDYDQNFTYEYFKHVFCHGTEEQVRFLVTYNKALIGPIFLKTINTIIPHINDINIEMIFKYGSTTIGTEPFLGLEQTIKLLSHHPMQVELISIYLSKFEKKFNEKDWINFRDIILRYFPEDLAKFKHVSIISDYISSLNNKKDPFIDVEVSSTIYLRVDCNILKSSYPLPMGTLNLYINSLEYLIKSLEVNKSSNGVVKIHVQKSMPNAQYQYTHIYININERSLLTKEKVKSLIHSYYNDFLTDFLKTYTDNGSIINNTNRWSEAKLRHDELEENLQEKKSSKFHHKI